MLEEKRALPDELIELMKTDEWVPLRGKSGFIFRWPEAVDEDPILLNVTTEKLVNVKLALERMGIKHRFSTMEVGDDDRVKMKICLVGDKRVGKSSIIRRYVKDQFDDGYLRTMGSKVMKKTLELEHPEGGRKIVVDMTIWDIMGNLGLADLLLNSYLHGAQGIIAVCDVTRKTTLQDLGDWINQGREIAGDIPVHILVNKADMHNEFDFDRDEVVQSTQAVNPNVLFTSARTGDNVEAAFRELAIDILSMHTEKEIVEAATPV